MKKWWDFQGNSRVMMVYQAMPNIILWFLWKRRNTILHGGSYSSNKVIWDINSTIHKFIRLKFNLLSFPNNWPQMIFQLEKYRPVFHSKVVRWIPPPVGWLKCNTDGASRGNPGPSSVAFCVRNHDGNLVGAKDLQIPDTSNLVAEAKAICEGLQYYLDKRFSNIIPEGNE